jgi:hypothetical protein
MKFQDVSEAVKQLSLLLESKLGQVVIDPLTLEEPKPPEDELHFLRLVNWGYVLLNEAGQPVFRELVRLLKSVNPSDARSFGEAKRDIEALRTWTAHNLAGESGNNQRTITLAKAWIITRCGQEPNWPVCCKEMCNTLLGMISSLTGCFQKILQSEQDSSIAISQIINLVNNAWPVHTFDEYISKIAIQRNLQDMDVVAYRKSHFDEWTKLGNYFTSREEAIKAIERAIASEMDRIFGSP